MHPRQPKPIRLDSDLNLDAMARSWRTTFFWYHGLTRHKNHGTKKLSGCQGGCNTKTALTQARSGPWPRLPILTISRFHNLSDEALADALGHADAVLKGAEAECKSLKDEFKRRGLVEAAGDHFTVTATEQIAGRLDIKAVKEYLGDSCAASRLRRSQPSSASRPFSGSRTRPSAR